MARTDGGPRNTELGWLAIALVVVGLVLLGISLARAGGDADRDDGSIDGTPTPSPASALAGLRTALDPGHNGGNAAHPEQINTAVPDGRGGTKACNTTGTATDDGYPEHAFAWDVALRAKDLLERAGATVLLTREGNDGVGPCVDERGRFAQEHDADVLVSIHADGNEDKTLHGFFAIVSDPPLHPSQGEPSLALAEDLLAALADAGFTVSPGHPDGLSFRSDIAGLNHAERPAVLLELGQMRNGEDAAVMSSPRGRERFAEAIVAGLGAWAERRRG